MSTSFLRLHSSSSLGSNSSRTTQTFASFTKISNQNLFLSQNRGFSASQSKFTNFSGLQSEGTVTVLQNKRNGANIFMIGTAHVSRESAKEVKEVIQHVKPTTVFVELDRVRAAKLRNADQSLTAKGFEEDVMKSLTSSPMFSNPFAAFGLQMLKKYFARMYDVFRQFGIIPGEEFKVAMEEADRTKAKIVYGDIDSNVTLQNIWKGLDIKDLMNMMNNPSQAMQDLSKKVDMNDMKSVLAMVETLKDRQTARTLRGELTKAVPGIAKALIEDRDKHMANELKQCTGTVVAVVGLAHMDGIENHFNK